MNETIPIKQGKFSNGEVSPLLRGDASHPKYAASLKLCQNWIPIPQGPIVKRPGFKFIAPVKDASYTPRLLKFVFSDNQSFVIEFGNLYARFYQNGKYVGNDFALHTYGDAYAGGYYELVTPFTTAMLPFLNKTAQVGNTITICYGGQVAGVAGIAPRDLVHTSGAPGPWAISATPLKIPITSVVAAPVVNINAWNSITTYKLGDFVSNGGILWISIQSNNLNNTPPAAALNSTSTALAGTIWWMPGVDLAHTAMTVTWVSTAVVQDPTGVTFETLPSAGTTGTGPLSLDRVVPLLISGVFTPALPAGWTHLYSKVYRAPANGIFGWISDVAVGSNFNDDGRAPDYSRQPPKGLDPFLVNGADSFPSVVGYLDQRRLWADSLLLPASIFLSKIGDLYNYDSRNTPGADSDSMNLLLASDVLEQIRSFIPLRRGLVFTSQGEWAISGQGGAPISRSNNDPKRQTTWGSSWLNPIKIGSGVLFNTAKSNMVRDFYPLYGLYADIWDGQDLSVMARHLLELNTIRNWDFQSVPYPVVWAVRDDGVLLSLTYQHAPPSFGQQLADGIVAWAQHTTGVGSDAFEDVVVTPEPPEDAIYCIVKRVVAGVTVRSIERGTSPVCPASPYLSGVSDVRYGKYLDACFTYDGHNDQLGLSGNTGTIDSVAVPGSANPVDYVIGKQVKVTINTPVFTALDAAAPYGSAFVFDPENTLAMNDPVLGPVRGRVVGFTSTAIVTIELDVAMTQAQVTAWRASQTKWAIAKGQVTAAYLSGYQLDSGSEVGVRGVTCLADGDVQAPAVWAAGVASLRTPAVVIHLGISYNADASLLDAWHPQMEIRNKLKNVLRMAFEVAFARDMWVGKDFDSLAQWQQRQVSDLYGVMQPQTGYFEEFVIGEWGKAAQGVVRHFQPLPATIVSLIREVRLGDT